jgi:hypothetical protein
MIAFSKDKRDRREDRQEVGVRECCCGAYPLLGEAATAEYIDSPGDPNEILKGERL